MDSPVREIIGTWEEVAAHSTELRGRRVRLVILDEIEFAVAERLRRVEFAAGRIRGPQLQPEALRRENLYGDDP